MIHGDNVYLKLIEENDLLEFQRLSNAAALQKENIFWPKWLFSHNQVIENYKNNIYWDSDQGTLLILHAKDNTLIGFIKFFKPVKHFDGYEIGFLNFKNENKNKGFITEAVNLLVPEKYFPVQLSK